jgi:hypothetical protein
MPVDSIFAVALLLRCEIEALRTPPPPLPPTPAPPTEVEIEVEEVEAVLLT